MSSASDIIITGGGIIGCSIAYRLSGEGLHVTVIDAGRPGEESSRAAAGMLAPQSEAAHGLGGSFSELCLASHSIYPAFVAELEEETGIRIGYNTPGSIFVAMDFVEATALAGLLERQLAAGRPAEELSAEQLRELEPAIADTVQSGVYLPEDHYIDNRALLRAVIEAGCRRGVEFLAGTPAIGLDLDGPRVTGVRVPGRSICCGTVINAAGCWAGCIDRIDQRQIPVRPVRGQIVRLEQRPQLRHLLHSSGCYIVPWPGGRTLVGATVESAGHNKETTSHGIHQLLGAALSLVPSLASAGVGTAWAGLRPGTPDDLPILGAGGISNLMIATGHFRNGILLAPITAQLITELVLTGQPSRALDPYSPERFSTTL